MYICHMVRKMPIWYKICLGCNVCFVPSGLLYDSDNPCSYLIVSKVINGVVHGQDHVLGVGQDSRVLHHLHEAQESKILANEYVN